MSKEKFYITTAIPYTSSTPHIGNIYEAVLTDAIARHKRLEGRDVFFLTGTDEHGLKIEQKAKEAGVTPKEYVDKMSARIRAIWDMFQISYDRFIRTTDEDHVRTIQKIFTKLYEQGDIYKATYEGNYCVPCESSWTDSQLVDGKCPDCGREVTHPSEEAYFFRMSKYADKLVEYYDSNPAFFIPESRKNEMLNNFIKPGLQDLCVSRSTFTWGVPVEFDPKHVVYVWMDALPNYISALGYDPENPGENYKKYWPADLHVLGKDVVRFHTIYWPIFLLALGEPLPKTVLGHPWLMMNNDKMSKSKGNVLYGDELIELFGLDAVRYYLLSEMGLQNDGNISYDALINRTNTDLANIFGNLVSRTASMIKQYFGGRVPLAGCSDTLSDALKNDIAAESAKAQELMDSYRVADASAHIISIFKLCNKYIDDTAPWVLAKNMAENGEKLARVLADLTEGIRIGITLLQPFMPGTAQIVKDGFKFDDVSFASAGSFIYNAAGKEIGELPILFKRIDKAAFEKEQKAKQEEAERKAEEGKISIEDFAKVSLVAAKVLECEPVPKSDKLLRLVVDIGTEKRQVASGIAKYYKPEDLIGKTVILVENLRSAVLRGVKSQGMILASASGDDVKVVFLDDSVPAGAQVR
ncbi:MAG: methionine--tRNA ligase [Clostridia bacterium]|nr:methionine--tRNA ligase [Clostridia bacterium]